MNKNNEVTRRIGISAAELRSSYYKKNNVFKTDSSEIRGKVEKVKVKLSP
jgi:hypothetical protein